MLEDLRRAFQEAVANFRAELEGGEEPSTLSDLLLRMDREVTGVRIQVEQLQDELARALALGQSAEREAATCRRRERLAREAGDEETAEIAARFAARYERKQEVQTRKALALKDELELARSELEEMEARFRELRNRRESSAEAADSAGADSNLENVDQVLGRIGEIEPSPGKEEELRRARQELEQELSVGSTLGDDDFGKELMAEVMLRQLKERLGRQ